MSFASYFHEIVSGRQQGVMAATLRGCLAACEPVYQWAIARKNRQFDSGRIVPERVAAPVISVGNITVGGTGKTPLVLWLAKWLQDRAVSLTIISRGYGGRSGRPNDEALELAARLPGVPHLQNPDRIAAARQALAQNPQQVLLLDDAFQHRRLARDLDIVLLDALEPFGYGRLLPRGLLREPVTSLSRAHVIGLSRADAVDAARREEIRLEVASQAPHALWLELTHQPTELRNALGVTQQLESLRGQRVAAFCGIGNPVGFRHTLAQCGFEVAAFREFSDHSPYDAQVLSSLSAWLSKHSDIAAVVCTQKDLVKIPDERLARIPLWAVQVDLEMTAGRSELEARLQSIIQEVAQEKANPKR